MIVWNWLVVMGLVVGLVVCGGELMDVVEMQIGVEVFEIDVVEIVVVEMGEEVCYFVLDVFEGVLMINWDDFLLEGELECIQEIFECIGLDFGIDYFGGQMMQIGMFNVENELIGEIICMLGFILLFDFQEGGEIGEFLLVLYFGVCVYMLLLLLNQIVYVML